MTSGSPLLVPVIPPNVMVKITSVPTFYSEDGAPDWLVHDLRYDWLIVVHELTELNDHARHAGPAQMLALLQQWGYFPGMHSRVVSHWKDCVHCKHKQQHLRNVGLSVRCFKRFARLLFDAWKTSSEIFEATGIPAILTMVDEAGNLIRFAVHVLEDMSAHSAAIALYIHWFSEFGWPEVAVSDQAPEYASEVMAAVCDLFNIDKRFAALHV